MIKVALLFSGVALVAAVLTPPALAKGATQAEIAGPGLDGPISLAGEGQPEGEQLTLIAQAAGFFPAMFGYSASRFPHVVMLSERPRGDLGPRYTITYAMPGPNNELDRLRQDVYPYAKPNPVTYTPPGQRFFGSRTTYGGWFVGWATLDDALVEAGLPRNPPSVTDDTPPFAMLAMLGIALAAGAAFLLRRRPRAATTA